MKRLFYSVMMLHMMVFLAALYASPPSLAEDTIQKINYLTSVTGSSQPDQILFTLTHPFTYKYSITDNSIHIQFNGVKLHKFLTDPEYSWIHKMGNFFYDLDVFQVTMPHPMMVDVYIKFVHPKILNVLPIKDHQLVVAVEPKLVKNQEIQPGNIEPIHSVVPQELPQKTIPQNFPSLQKKVLSHKPRHSKQQVTPAIPTGQEEKMTADVTLDKRVVQDSPLDPVEVLMQEKKYSEALGLLKKIVRKRTVSIELYELMGDCYVEINAPALAFKHYKKAVSFIHNTDPVLLGKLYFKLGNSLRLKGDQPGAISYYEQSLKYNNTNPNVYYNLGSTYLAMKKIVDAKTNLVKFIELSQDLSKVEEIRKVLSMLEF